MAPVELSAGYNQLIVAKRVPAVIMRVLDPVIYLTQCIVGIFPYVVTALGNFDNNTEKILKGSGVIFAQLQKKNT